mmetsp:Transcript_53614/g.155853  ORF Transcript_53614/g.155853 Transcript_53614/m.155853 type:complete len:89 (+) Transcript_53614:158-424(+)
MTSTLTALNSSDLDSSQPDPSTADQIADTQQTEGQQQLDTSESSGRTATVLSTIVAIAAACVCFILAAIAYFKYYSLNKQTPVPSMKE